MCFLVTHLHSQTLYNHKHDTISGTIHLFSIEMCFKSLTSTLKPYITINMIPFMTYITINMIPFMEPRPYIAINMIPFMEPCM